MATDESTDQAADQATDEGGGLMRTVLLLLGLLGAAGYVLKRKREQELDEALWEEPRPL